jgi:hypothetical protein
VLVALCPLTLVIDECLESQDPAILQIVPPPSSATKHAKHQAHASAAARVGLESDLLYLG